MSGNSQATRCLHLNPCLTQRMFRFSLLAGLTYAPPSSESSRAAVATVTPGPEVNGNGAATATAANPLLKAAGTILSMEEDEMTADQLACRYFLHGAEHGSGQWAITHTQVFSWSDETAVCLPSVLCSALAWIALQQTDQLACLALRLLTGMHCVPASGC